MWEHLKDNQLDDRFKLAVQAVNMKGKHVVDLNCGYGHLVKYLPKVKSYIGNDNGYAKTKI